MSPGELIRDRRRFYGLSQRQLAVRASTTQGWVSAIERGDADPTTEMLRRLLLAMGEELMVDSRRLTGHAQHDPVAFAENRQRSAEERLAEAAAWIRLTGS